MDSEHLPPPPNLLHMQSLREPTCDNAPAPWLPTAAQACCRIALPKNHKGGGGIQFILQWKNCWPGSKEPCNYFNATSAARDLCFSNSSFPSSQTASHHYNRREVQKAFWIWCMGQLVIVNGGKGGGNPTGNTSFRLYPMLLFGPQKIYCELAVVVPCVSARPPCCWGLRTRLRDTEQKANKRWNIGIRFMVFNYFLPFPVL